MANFRRWFIPGGTFFFTLVSYDRRPILTTATGRVCLRKAIRSVQKTRPFRFGANVLLPEHWHFVMHLPQGDDGYSQRIKRIKVLFGDYWLSAGREEVVVTRSQHRRGERGIWQPRFWEHCVQDEEDLDRCADYIHWNPRKHGLVERVADWPWSTFHRYVREGHYDINWGGTQPTFEQHSDWGEPTGPNRK